MRFRTIVVTVLTAVLGCGFGPAAIAEPFEDSQVIIIGGDVIRHDSIQNLIIAKDIRNYNAGYGSNCAIWNWNGGNTWNYVNPGGNCRTASMMHLRCSSRHTG